MSERRLGQEAIVTGVLSALGLGLLAHLSLYGFSEKTKEEAFHKQGCVCPVCHSANHKKWEGHHAVCRSLGGTNSVDNCVTVGGDRGRDCHEVLDRMALDEGTIFLPPHGPLVPIADAPASLFRSESLRERSLHRFDIGEAVAGSIRFVGEKIEHRKRKQRKKGHRKGNKGRR